MPAYARSEIVDASEVGIYHCVSRCVRRAFLCGEDALTGRNFDHRKDWIRDRLQELAGAFAIDVLGFAVLSNHLHVMLAFGPMLPVGSAMKRWRGVGCACFAGGATTSTRRRGRMSVRWRCCCAQQRGRHWFQGQAASRQAFT